MCFTMKQDGSITAGRVVDTLKLNYEVLDQATTDLVHTMAKASKKMKHNYSYVLSRCSGRHFLEKAAQEGLGGFNPPSPGNEYDQPLHSDMEVGICRCGRKKARGERARMRIPGGDRTQYQKSGYITNYHHHLRGTVQQASPGAARRAVRGKSGCYYY